MKPAASNFGGQFLEKPLPSNDEAERAVLGAILLDGDLISQAIEQLKPDDFYVPRHRNVFKAMIALFQKGAKIDPIAIAEELKKDDPYEATGGVTSITNLSFGLPHYSNILDHIKIVRDKSLLRELIRTCNSIIGDAAAESDDAEIILDHAEQAIFDLSESRTTQGFVSISDATERFLHRFNELRERDDPRRITGLATGFYGIDDMTSGLQRSDLIIVAARPSMGKTAFCLTLAQNCAIHSDAVVAFFSLEMSTEQLAMRMLASEANVDLNRFRSGSSSDGEISKIKDALARLLGAKIHIDDTAGLSVIQMRAKARRLAAEQKRLDLIIVDYLQLMSGGTRSESRQQEVSLISRELKALAKELNVPVIALSQLSRAPEARKPPKPLLSDLRDSGSIEQDADIVAFIYREAYYDATDENKYTAEVIIAKQRNGPTGSVKLSFLGPSTRFENLYEDSNY
ncbi:MAG: replicative DNA helicase [Chloracidobacterium sp.]|nr:replicative DNA helicase [Chloracidobacterium sp.]MCO5333023.1 replicative DNA helicase [Pyrinomonadaceae bacterium]